MEGVMGPQAWVLFVLGVLLACGHQIHGSESYDYSIRCTIGVKGGYVDACEMLRRGLSGSPVGDCMVSTSTEQGYYTLYEVDFKLDGNGNAGYYSREQLIGGWNVAHAGNGPTGGYGPTGGSGSTFVPGTFQCYDINECVDKTNECSGNAACYNEWGTYTCSCLDGYKDYSASGTRKGYTCDKEDGKPDDYQVDIQIWVYVLIAVAIFVVLMLLVCCCCCYSGSSDCCPSMHQARTKVIKHIKIIPQPVQACQAPIPAPPCICKPPEEKKIIIQVDQAPQAAPAPAPAPALQFVEPMVSGPSAFIANSGYDGQVYIASPQAQPAQTVQCIQQEPQSQQVYQYIQQPQIIQQPTYDQEITTPYIYTVDVDSNNYYQ